MKKKSPSRKPGFLKRVFQVAGPFIAGGKRLKKFIKVTMKKTIEFWRRVIIFKFAEEILKSAL